MAYTPFKISGIPDKSNPKTTGEIKLHSWTGRPTYPKDRLDTWIPYGDSKIHSQVINRVSDPQIGIATCLEYGFTNAENKAKKFNALVGTRVRLTYVDSLIYPIFIEDVNVIITVGNYAGADMVISPTASITYDYKVEARITFRTEDIVIKEKKV